MSGVLYNFTKNIFRQGPSVIAEKGKQAQSRKAPHLLPRLPPCQLHPRPLLRSAWGLPGCQNSVESGASNMQGTGRTTMGTAAGRGREAIQVGFAPAPPAGGSAASRLRRRG